MFARPAQVGFIPLGDHPTHLPSRPAVIGISDKLKSGLDPPFPLFVLFGLIWCSLVLFGPKIYCLK